MIELANGYPVHAVWIVAGERQHGTMPQYGVVLSETDDNWVVWSIHFDPDAFVAGDRRTWFTTSGDYFHKGMPEEQGNPEQLARFQFGLKVARYMDEQTKKGIKSNR